MINIKFLDNTGLEKVLSEIKKLIDNFGKLSKKDRVSEIDLDTALKNKINNSSSSNHSHRNKEVLDKITQENIDKLNKINSVNIGDVVNVNSALIGTQSIGVQASLTFQKLSDTKGNLHISYHIIRNDMPSDEIGFLSTNAISNVLNLNFSWADYFAQSRMILIPLFKNNPGDRLEITSAYTTSNPELEIGENGLKIGIERSSGNSLIVYPSNDSNPALKLNSSIFAVGTYGFIDIYGMEYSKK